jgi:hypothetical protein
MLFVSTEDLYAAATARPSRKNKYYQKDRNESTTNSQYGATHGF